MRSTMIFIIAMILIAFLVLIGPLAGIWALNTLFPALAIEYTFSTWLAAAIVMAVLTPNVKITKKS